MANLHTLPDGSKFVEIDLLDPELLAFRDTHLRGQRERNGSDNTILKQLKDGFDPERATLNAFHAVYVKSIGRYVLTDGWTRTTAVNWLLQHGKPIGTFNTTVWAKVDGEVVGPADVAGLIFDHNDKRFAFGDRAKFLTEFDIGKDEASDILRIADEFNVAIGRTASGSGDKRITHVTALREFFRLDGTGDLLRLYFQLMDEWAEELDHDEAELSARWTSRGMASWIGLFEVMRKVDRPILFDDLAERLTNNSMQHARKGTNPITPLSVQTLGKAMQQTYSSNLGGALHRLRVFYADALGWSLYPRLWRDMVRESGRSTQYDWPDAGMHGTALPKQTY